MRAGRGSLLPPGFDPASVRAIASDLDGTLLDGRTFQPSARTIAAVEAAEASGITVILATGRMFQSARRIAATLDVHGPIVCYQGGLVGESDTGEILLHHPIEIELAREMLHALGPHTRTTNAYVDDELYVTEANEEAVRYARIAGVEMHVVGDLATWLERPTTKLVTVGEPSWLDPLRDEMQERFGDRAFVAKSLPIFLEFAAAGVSKSSAMTFLGDRLGFGPEHCVAFGDGENDRDLLAWAGLGVSVANAAQELQDESDWVVPSVTDDGVARFIEQVVAARGDGVRG
ncbi:MAG TPA: Cof-type HAD-IIB family hydrolase [Gaiellales bacterium]